MVVLIPAFEPDHQLVDVVDRLRERDPLGDIVVIDDGSGPEYAAVFAAVAARGCAVLDHDTNLGKGAALRTGLLFAQRAYPGAEVICADSDGQHAPDDILAVGRATRARPGAVVLGVREFTGPVPVRSRLGNSATRLVFRFVTGVDVTDTQTGLRGYSADLIPWLLDVAGERYAYEMSVLVEAARTARPIVTVPIATIYEAGNPGSHFRPLVDSARVYLPLVRFAASSLVAFVLDLLLLVILMGLTDRLLLSVVLARLVSSAVNFAVNRRFVFDARAAPLLGAALRYYALAAALLGVNYLVLATFVERLGVALLPAKLLTEVILFLVSYVVQRAHVFGSATGRPQHSSRPARHIDVALPIGSHRSRMGP